MELRDRIARIPINVTPDGMDRAARIRVPQHACEGKPLKRLMSIFGDSHRPQGLFSAKGAVFTLAWGSAPGTRKSKTASAESAIHSGAFPVHH